jgi:peroxiredoxin
MFSSTDTLKIGNQAPDFTLSAANREERYSLAELRKRGPVIVEFLRGTW